MWSDGETTIHEMREDVARFIEERDWRRYHHPVNVASAAAVEAGELLELFQWRRPGDEAPEDVVREAGSELADVLHFTLCLANAVNANLESDGRTVDAIVDEGKSPREHAKDEAEEVLIGATFILMAARASDIAREAAAAVHDGGPENAMLVAIEFQLSAIARCARALGLDLAGELWNKNRLNEERYPVGSKPDVGY
jgi:dCTP diphosphatase